MKNRWPLLLSVLVALVVTGWRLSLVNWQAAGLAQMGTRYAEGQLNGTEGYDGQFDYYIALEPDPHIVDIYLDVPAYRYQRILLPVLARLLAFGQESWVAWTLVLVNLLGFTLGVWSLQTLLLDRGRRPAYALTLGLWAGFVGGVALDLNEPLAYGLVAAAWLAQTRRRWALAAMLFSLSILAKETSAVFWLAALAASWLGGQRESARAWLVVPGMVLAAWQGFLWLTFGHPGLGSGGAMATPFEWIPFMGLLRVGFVNPRVLLLYLVIFGPSIAAPAVWGLVAGGRSLVRSRVSPEAWALVLNSAVIVFLPFSSFREPFGLVRVATGLVLAVVLFASEFGVRRALNYALFWAAYLPMLFVPGQ